jgi:flavin reductase (DIM6/NTAB) family NADH-FMN oxidoreductase RutF
MILDPRETPATDVYRFLISAVVPRPIALVSTRGADGGTNVAPFSYFNAIASDPPLVGVAVANRAGDPKDTLRNVRETGEFVVNVVDTALLDAMVRTAGEWPREVSEFAPAGLTPLPSERVGAPYVAESPLQLECRLHREIPLGNSVLLVGEVVFARVRDAVLTEGRVDPSKLLPVGRLGGELYALPGEVVKRPRPRVSRTTGEELGPG